jgi:hypothetical protein
MNKEQDMKLTSPRARPSILKGCSRSKIKQIKDLGRNTNYKYLPLEAKKTFCFFEAER